jgi:hypothetical protein
MIPGQISVLSMEHDCLVSDLSLGGAGLQFSGEPPCSEAVCVLAMDYFGKFAGITTRDTAASIGVRFLMGETERHQLQLKLTSFINDGLSSVVSSTNSISQSQMSIVLTSGEHHQCDVVNISLRGVSLKTQIRPPVGELIRLGRVYGRVTHHQDEGFALQFVNCLNPKVTTSDKRIN